MWLKGYWGASSSSSSHLPEGAAGDSAAIKGFEHDVGLTLIELSSDGQQVSLSWLQCALGLEHACSLAAQVLSQRTSGPSHASSMLILSAQ